MRENLKKMIIIGILAILAIAFIWWKIQDLSHQKETLEPHFQVNLNKLENYKTYAQSDFQSFLNDYNNNQLEDIYITKFLFDGVSMYKPLDLDEFINSADNNLEVEPLEITVINLHKPGTTTITGEIQGAMIAVNTNNQTQDFNLELNGVKLDTSSKNIPAIYVYNKDRTYDQTKVRIKPLEKTKNYLSGGELKKVSLLPKDELENDASNYIKEEYELYANYYGVYTQEEIDRILFARVQSDNEGLEEGDPYYYYKASGAISSDIDLIFEGKGYLEVTSQNKEGIESKGNLTFAKGIGDYLITAQDDCLNTTTNANEVTNARNTLTIDVNSLTSIVSLESKEGDAIDSNGELIINNGTIIALAKPGQDAGLDAEKGIYINKGTIISTGDMYVRVNNESKQNFMVLSLSQDAYIGRTLTLLDESNNILFSYTTDRTYKTLLFSSPKLTYGTYFLYQEGTINGTKKYGLYQNVISYKKGTELAYAKASIEGPENREKNYEEQGEPKKEFIIDKTENLFGEVAVYTSNN